MSPYKDWIFFKISVIIKVHEKTSVAIEYWFHFHPLQMTINAIAYPTLSLSFTAQLISNIQLTAKATTTHVCVQESKEGKLKEVRISFKWGEQSKINRLRIV